MSLNVRVGQYSIHSRESIEFYRSLNCKCKCKCQNYLYSGTRFKVGFREIPPYFEENNTIWRLQRATHLPAPVKLYIFLCVVLSPLTKVSPVKISRSNGRYPDQNRV